MLPGHNNVHRLDVQQHKYQRPYNIHEDMFNIFKNMKNIICFNSLRWIKFQRHSSLLYYKFQLHVFKNVYQKRVFFWGGEGGIGSLFILTCIKIRGYVKTSLLISQRCVEWHFSVLYTIWRHNYTLPSSAFILKVLRICVVKSKVIFLKK